MTDSPIKQAFSKVKGDIKALEGKFELINTKLDQILQKKEINNPNSYEFSQNKPQKDQIQEISSGNEGVQSINHSTITQQSLNNHSLNNQSKKVEDRFKSLTNQEFRVFLTIYNLEDQLGRGINYDDIASKLSLSTSCIRSYISSMLRKGIPLTKTKLNNRSTILKINSHFRELALKERITSIYLGQDPNQTTLF